jgi:hypothetical protein
MVKCKLCNDLGGWEDGSGPLAEPVDCPNCTNGGNKMKQIYFKVNVTQPIEGEEKEIFNQLTQEQIDERLVEFTKQVEKDLKTIYFNENAEIDVQVEIK